MFGWPILLLLIFKNVPAVEYLDSVLFSVISLEISDRWDYKRTTKKRKKRRFFPRISDTELSAAEI